MVMMTFQTRIKRSRKPTQPRIRFDLEKLNDLLVMNTFQTTNGGIIAPLTMLVDEYAELDSIVTEFNKVVTETAAELLDRRKSPGLLTKSLIVLTKENER